MKKYNLKLDKIGLTLFLVLMLPTFFWAIVPSTNDVLRVQSKTPQIDVFASVLQAIMVILMCSFSRKEIEDKKLNKAMNYYI